MEKIRLGIIGAGRLGGFHAAKAAAHPKVELTGIFDPSEEARCRTAAKFGVPDFSDLDLFFSHVDAVVIATPSVLHFRLGRAAVQAGKHILMEKPITTTGAEGLELLRQAQEHKIVFQVGHIEQYNPAWRAAESWLEKYRLGKKAVLFAERKSGYSFRSTDIGVTLDLMIHDLELILSLIQSPVTSVEADGFIQLGGYEDTAFAVLHFENGSSAHLTASRVEHAPGRKMKIVGQNEVIDIDFQANTVARTIPDRQILDGQFAPEKYSAAQAAPFVASFMQEHYQTELLENNGIDALAAEMDDFCSAILDGIPSRVPAERAVRAVLLADLIMKKMAQ